ncbi:ABC transporter permease [Streptomyces sp. NPDC004111]|uniref:ABC transporter permease n=1 Tax=Streptomyces sp. NPDC004111 TaxID=3364690 RepID=UPI0036A2148E
MSALTLLPTLRGPQWVTMRQHRTTARVFAWVVLAAALGVAAFLIAAGTDPKGSLAHNADTGMAMVLGRSTTALGLLPALAGAFVAGPLVARELESGTYTWLWTQSVPPVRWLAAKLALATAVILGGATVLVVLFRLARGGLKEESAFSLSWFGSAYEMLGPVMVAQCALGVGVGTLVGLLVRRTVPAMVTTGLAVILTQVAFFSFLRELLWPVETITPKALFAGTPNVQMIQEGMLTATGERIPVETCLGPTGVGNTLEGCMADLGGVRNFADVHPESHFWPLQLVESGILLLLATVALTVAFRVLRRRYGVGA